MKRVKDGLRQKLKALTALVGVSGREAPVVRYLKEVLPDVADRVEMDTMGNVLAYRCGAKPGPTVMLAAHADEIGAMVRSIEPGGFIRFQKIGGTLDPLLPARKVSIRGHLGIIGVKAGHLMSETERNAVKSASELYIDVGVDSAQAVAALGIEVGDPVVMQSELEFFANGERFCGRAIDNRLGCSVLWQLFEDLDPADLEGTLVGVWSVQEEVGLKGATVAAYKVKPDLAIALDTMPAGDTPDVVYHQELAVSLGQGPVLQVSSGSSGRGLLLHPVMERLMREAARSESLPLQRAVLEGGNTDASAIQWVGGGIPAAPLTLPRRYSHSPVEMGDINDAVNCVRLLKAFLRKAPHWKEYSFCDG